MVKHLHNLKKFAVLAIAMLAISLSANAQQWYVMGEYIWSPPHPQGTFTEVHYQAEDVTISGMEYHTIYIQGQGVLLGAYRNDGNQVYYRKWNGSSYDGEVLLYDYDLDEGDFFNEEDVHMMQVTEVTMITDENHVTRKKITFSFMGLPDETEFWIEGVGSSKGFVNSCNYTPTEDGAIFHLLCYHVSDDVIYVNPEYNECDMPYAVEDNQLNNDISIYPNPAADIFKILNSNNLDIYSVEIIDLVGRTVMITDNTDSIDISAIPEGQYFVKIYGDNTIVRKLFIKK